MKTEATIIRPPNKYIITFGIIGGVTLIIITVVFMLMYPDVVRIGGYVILGVIGLKVAKGVIIGAAKGYYWIVAKEAAKKRDNYLQIPHTTSVVDTRTGGVIVRAHGLNSSPTLVTDNVMDGDYTTTVEPVDFYTAMSGAKQAYKIIAEQRRGKSYLGMHISDYIAARGLGYCIVIGTKYEPGEWPNCKRFLVDYNTVESALGNLINEVNTRHANQTRLPVLRVFLDDWINTVIEHKSTALEFLDLASTKMVSAGIIPYFLLQGDGNDDWGSKRSAMLKNNFTGLWVSGPRDANGDPVPQQNTAHLVYPGNREQLPVRLPVGLPRLGSNTAIHRLPAPRTDTPPQCAGVDCTNLVSMGPNGWKMYCDENYARCKQSRYRLSK